MRQSIKSWLRLRSRHFEIAFPRMMVLSLKLLAVLPARLRFAATRRMIRT